jgi:hypothetical protein
MRHLPLPLLTLGAIALFASAAHAREITELRERVRDGVQRADKDLGSYVHRDKLTEEQRTRFDAAQKDLKELGEAVTGKRWEDERGLLEHVVENIDFLEKHAPIDDGDRQVLRIDVYTLNVILDNWKP